MKTTKILFTCLSLGILFFASCKGPLEEVETVTVLQTLSYDAEDTLFDNHSRVQGAGHSGQYGFRTDSTNEYAATAKIDINDSLLNKGIRLVLNFWVRTTNPLKGDGMAVAYQDNNEMVLFSSLDAINYGIKPNEWLYVTDSITIKAENNTKPGRFFKVFSFNPNHKAQVDIDELSITLKKVVTTLE